MPLTPRRQAFTLIELLVVIAVVALLIGILVPSLAGARRVARLVVCQANMRSVATSMAVYINDSKDFLPGPNSSGSDLQQGRAYVPGTNTPSQDWDFVSPILGDSMNLSTDQLGKFEQICNLALRCPSNTVRYTQLFAGTPLPSVAATGQHPFVLSYLTPAYFQLYPTGTSVLTGRSVESLPNSEPISLRRGYSPRLDQVGFFPDRKVSAFEGARFWFPTINGFDYSTVTNAAGLSGSPQGNFASRGPAFQGSGEPYFRLAGQEPTPLFRSVSLRHDNKMNASFFDTHVSSLNNVESADPSLYVPSNSIMRVPSQSWWINLGPSDSPLRQVNAVIP